MVAMHSTKTTTIAGSINLLNLYRVNRPNQQIFDVEFSRARNRA
jgi:hypothetical protein